MLPVLLLSLLLLLLPVLLLTQILSAPLIDVIPEQLTEASLHPLGISIRTSLAEEGVLETDRGGGCGHGGNGELQEQAGEGWTRRCWGRVLKLRED